MRRLAVAATLAALAFFGCQTATAAAYLKYEFTAYGSDFDPQITGGFTAYLDLNGYTLNGSNLSYITFDHTQPPGAPPQYLESCTALADGAPATCDSTQVFRAGSGTGAV